MKALVTILLLLLTGCEDEHAKAEKARQDAVQREVEARVKAEASVADSVSTLRVVIYGVTAVAGLVVLQLTGNRNPLLDDLFPPQGDESPPRTGNRVLDLSHHENPPRR